MPNAPPAPPHATALWWVTTILYIYGATLCEPRYHKSQVDWGDSTQVMSSAQVVVSD